MTTAGRVRRCEAGIAGLLNGSTGPCANDATTTREAMCDGAAVILVRVCEEHS